MVIRNSINKLILEIDIFELRLNINSSKINNYVWR